MTEPIDDTESGVIVANVQAQLRELATAAAAALTDELGAAVAAHLIPLQERIAALTVELRSEREEHRVARFECKKAQTARAQAESALEDAQNARHRLWMRMERDLRDSRAESEVQKSEIARLTAQLDVQPAVPVKTGTALVAPPQEVAEPANVITARRFTVPLEAAPFLKLPVTPSLTPAMSEAVSVLLSEIEAKYAADTKEGIEPAELVERLTASLGAARRTYVEEVSFMGIHDCDGFARGVADLIDVRANTAFGRHLAIATYADEHTQETGSELADVG